MHEPVDKTSSPEQGGTSEPPRPMQEALALQISYVPTLAHFVPGPNQELLHRLQALQLEFLDGEAPSRTFFALHLWGAEGAGKSFLCECMRHRAAASSAIEIHDNVEQASAAAQEALLQSFNRLQSSRQGLWLSTSRQPPTQLPLLADLRSRLSWGLVYELKTLADEDKFAALQAWAHSRGLPLAADVIPWLLHHQSRNLAHLTRLLLDFDRFGLQSKRALSLSLLRQWLQSYRQPPVSRPLG